MRSLFIQKVVGIRYAVKIIHNLQIMIHKMKSIYGPMNRA